MRHGGTEDDQEEVLIGGLTYGLTAWHIRVLCDNTMDGGRGFTPREVGEMTVDQVLMQLCDRKILRNRTKTIDSTQTALLADEQGRIKGRAADGTPILGRVGGKSKARQLMEAAKARREEEEKQKPRRRRRKAGQ